MSGTVLPPLIVHIAHREPHRPLPSLQTCAQLSSPCSVLVSLLTAVGHPSHGRVCKCHITVSYVLLMLVSSSPALLAPPFSSTSLSSLLATSPSKPSITAAVNRYTTSSFQTSRRSICGFILTPGSQVHIN
ncbi:hypothetical protein B0H13DRAFT_2355517 [Mycena leptocephala]|nr:hypothetical protein B0H13DRAFT_2355517 [Mycena leptocephala]